MFVCRYCSKTCKNKNSLIQHELRCKYNPNKIVSYFSIWNNMEGHVAWNKGLTKDDPRVLQQSKTLKESYDSGKITSHNKGKKTREDVKEKISVSLRNFYKNNPSKVPYLLNHSSKISYPEQYFMDVFKNENINLRYHKMINRYELDFYNEDLKKYIEIDGEQHYSEKSRRRDLIRDEFLKSLGWSGMRIRWKEFINLNEDEKNKVIEQIKNFLCP